MERVQGMINIFLVAFSLFFVGCASKSILQSENAEEVHINKEYDEIVKVKEIDSPKTIKPKPVVKKEDLKKVKKIQPKFEPVKEKKIKKKKEPKKIPKKKVITKAPKIKLHLPKLEDSEGFDGRRPLVDPFVVGEKATFSMKYFNMAAGEMTMEIMPMVEVNERKAYHFRVTLKSSDMFSYVYKIDDTADTFVDYETLKPFTFDIRVKESKQLKDIRSYFDWKNMTATMWVKRVTEEKGVEKKKIKWGIEQYAQNVISAPFYLRVFNLKVGKDLAFRVADEGKNLVFKGKVLRKETIETVIGDLETIVVQPKVTIDGVFKQMGDVFFWMTDDEYKTIVRIEAKIKVGTIVGSLKSLER